MTQRSTFIIEAINSINGGALMIPSQQEEVLRVLDLIGQHETNTLNGLFSPVNIVPQEEVVLVAGVPSVLEQLDKVRVLAVDVAWVRVKCTADFDWGLKLEQHWLGQENLAGLEA
jgi:hypothetical protein